MAGSTFSSRASLPVPRELPSSFIITHKCWECLGEAPIQALSWKSYASLGRFVSTVTHLKTILELMISIKQSIVVVMAYELWSMSRVSIFCVQRARTMFSLHLDDKLTIINICIHRQVFYVCRVTANSCHITGGIQTKTYFTQKRRNEWCVYNCTYLSVLI